MGHFTPYLKITVKVLAELSGRHQETVRRHIHAGKFDPFNFWSIRDWLDTVGRAEVVGRLKVGDPVRHLPTGRTGVYMEHLNVGEGYMVKADDLLHPPVICGPYGDFELVNKSKGEL